MNRHVVGVGEIDPLCDGVARLPRSIELDLLDEDGNARKKRVVSAVVEVKVRVHDCGYLAERLARSSKRGCNCSLRE